MNVLRRITIVTTHNNNIHMKEYTYDPTKYKLYEHMKSLLGENALLFSSALVKSIVKKTQDYFRKYHNINGAIFTKKVRYA